MSEKLTSEKTARPPRVQDRAETSSCDFGNGFKWMPKNLATISESHAKRCLSRAFNKIDPWKLFFFDDDYRKRHCGDAVFGILERFPQFASLTFGCYNSVDESKMEFGEKRGRHFFSIETKWHPFFLLLWSGFPLECLQDVHSLYPISLETKHVIACIGV